MKRIKYVTIKELATVCLGYAAPLGERLKQGAYRYLTGRNLGDLSLRLREDDGFLLPSERPAFQRAILRPGDVIVSILFDERNLYVIKSTDPSAVAGDSLAILRNNEDAFLSDYLNTAIGRERFLKEATKATPHGRTIPRLRVADILAIRLPEPTPEEIERLVGDQSSLHGNELVSLIRRGESTRQEFKATLRRNLKTNANDPVMEDMVLKTIAAFCNTEGGTLFIGVRDDGHILGIEGDSFPNADKFCTHLTNLVNACLKPCPHGIVDYQMLTYCGRTVCTVTCNRSSQEVWLYPRSPSSQPTLYVREGPSSRPLEGPDLSKYLKEHFA